MPQYPQFVRELDGNARALAEKLRVPHANVINNNGLYIKVRHRRDPINTNRKRIVLKVQLRLRNEIVFSEIVERKGFPSDELITKLALVI